MKKGFTLIELLAVIVILAVIALIATPLILNVIEDSKISAAKESATGYIEAIEMYIGTSSLIDKNNLKINEKYNVTDVTILNNEATEALNDLVEVKGEKPSGDEDYIKLNDKYEVIEGKLTFGEYEVNIQNEEMTVSKIGVVVKVEDIILNLTNETMERGNTVNIKTTFVPSNTTNKKLKYKSSDESVVTVTDKGEITAQGNGTAKIIVTSVENSNIKKEIDITVVSPEYATNIKIEKEDKKLYVGNTVQLTGILEPNDVKSKVLTWTSSDDDIASVTNDGLVTGKKNGNVTITATTMNNKIASIDLEVRIKQSFKNDDWSTIVENIRSGNMEDYEIGDTKIINLGDLGNHTIRVANNTTPDECSKDVFSQTACGFVIEFADIITEHNMNATSTNVGGWPASGLRTYLNNDIYNKLPEELQNIIIDTKVVSGYGNADEKVNFISTDKLYLLSTGEVWKQGGGNPIKYDTARDETRQLDYYSKLGVTTKNYSGAIKKYLTSSGEEWRLRSSYYTGSQLISYFHTVNYIGNWSTANSASANLGISPAFRIG